MANEIMSSIQQHYGDQLGEADVTFLREIQQLAVAVEQDKCNFAEFVSAAWGDIGVLGNHKFDTAESIANGFRSKVSALVQTASICKAKPNATEMNFLKDVFGLIEFTIRNGLSFLHVIGILIHDLREIRTMAGDLEKAYTQGFWPKASGWAKLNEEIVGESVEVMT